jgi:hypothetical protein
MVVCPSFAAGSPESRPPAVRAWGQQLLDLDGQRKDRLVLHVRGVLIL